MANKKTIANLLKNNLKSKKRRFNIAFSLIIIVGILSAIIALTIFWNKNQIVEKVEIEGLNLLSKKEIISLFPENPIEKKKGDLDLDLFESAIKKHPYLLSVEIAFANIDELRVVCQERTPEAVIVDERGELAYFDAEGDSPLPYRLFEKPPDLPIISAPKTKNAVSRKKALNQCANFVKRLNKPDSRKLLDNISEISFQPELGFTLISVDGAEIYLGADESSAEKNLRKLKGIFEDSEIASEIRAAKYVDLRWSNKIILKKNI